MVYVTDYGTVYHRELSCRYLKLSIRQSGLSEVADLRNESGGKYYPCEKCWKEGADPVFLTDDGTRYHQSLNCSAMGTRNSYNSAFRNDAAALFRMRRLKNVEGILCGGAVAGERYMGL